MFNAYTEACFLVAAIVLTAWVYEHRLSTERKEYDALARTAANNKNEYTGLVKNFADLLRLHEVVVSEHAGCPTHVMVERLNRDLLQVQAEHSECPVPYVLADALRDSEVVHLEEWRGNKSHESSDYDWPFNLVTYGGTED